MFGEITGVFEGNGWFATVVLAAVVSGVVSALLNNLGAIGRMLQRLWLRIARICRHIQTKYRLHWARRIMMRQLMHEHSLWVRIESYASCLGQSPTSSSRDQLANAMTGSSKWLTDYFVAEALEALCQDNVVAKAKLHDRMSWPARPWAYQFKLLKPGESPEDIATELETNDLCSIYQGMVGLCPVETRFEWHRITETVSYDRTDHRVKTTLKEDAPTCKRCWDSSATTSRMGLLVARLIENDLRSALVEATLNHILNEAKDFYLDKTVGPFMESVMSECEHEGIGVQDVNAIKSVMQRRLDEMTAAMYRA